VRSTCAIGRAPSPAAAAASSGAFSRIPKTVELVLGVPKLYAKDESQNPTWSYKDRLCAVAVTHAVTIGAWSKTSPFVASDGL